MIKYFLNNYYRILISRWTYKNYNPTMLGRWDPKRRPTEILMNKGYYW